VEDKFLKERRLIFSTEGTFRRLLEATPYPNWRVIVDGRRTLQPLEIPILIKLYRRRSMGALISLGEPIDNSRPYNKGILSQHRQESSKMAALTT
jgi:hypothetical protein